MLNNKNFTNMTRQYNLDNLDNINLSGITGYYSDITLDTKTKNFLPLPNCKNKLSMDLKDFHTKFSMNEGWELTIQNLNARYEMMLEEVKEYKQAIESNDLVGTIDAICDLVYFALGTADLMDIDFDAHWQAVHDANMTKIRGHKTTRPNSFGFDMVKPEGWVGPEERHREILNQQAK